MEIESISREKSGRGDARRLRRSGYVPAILYGNGEPQQIALEERAVKIMMKDESFYSSVLSIGVGGKKIKALVREVQLHPSRADIIHIDFQSVRDDTEISTSVPLHFINSELAPGVKLHQGIFSTVENDVSIHCLPKHLPEAITVDVQHLDVGGNIHLSDIEVPEGVRFDALQRGENPVLALISAAKAYEEETPTAADAPAEGEPAAEGDAKPEATT